MQEEQSGKVYGDGGGPSEHVEEQVGGEESMGHNTALTLRGLIVVLLS
jgi:hypothetical protein